MHQLARFVWPFEPHVLIYPTYNMRVSHPFSRALLSLLLQTTSRLSFRIIFIFPLATLLSLVSSISKTLLILHYFLDLCYILFFPSSSFVTILQHITLSSTSGQSFVSPLPPFSTILTTIRYHPTRTDHLV